MKPELPLKINVHTIANGITREASRTSSDICTAESPPSKEVTDVVRPTRNESPVLGQPALFSILVQTSLLGAWGAVTQSTMRTTKNPTMCTHSTIASTSGSFRTRAVLKKMQTTAAAIARSVAW